MLLRKMILAGPGAPVSRLGEPRAADLHLGTALWAVGHIRAIPPDHTTLQSGVEVCRLQYTGTFAGSYVFPYLKQALFLRISKCT